jgi:RNA polymerase sigma-70 factor (ECF subfamily)
MELTDQQVIDAVLRGATNAFDLLVRRYTKLAYTVALRYVHSTEDAEDVTQDAFLNAFKNIKTFDTTRAFKPWLLQIVRNRALDVLKAKRPLAFSAMQDEDESWLDQIPDPALSPSETAEIRIEAARVEKAITDLPEQYRNVLSLRYIQRLTFREIGLELGEILDTVKTRHRRAVALLKKKLVQH